jgi:DNA-binding NarL/FixJ family response regulator
MFSELTSRELEVLRLIAQGLRNRAIAERLVISEKTVQNHVSNIFAKLQVNDRSEAIVRALQGGLLQQDNG